MKPLEIIEPRNDEYLEFNKITGKYQLTLSYVKNLFEGSVPFRNDGVTKKRIRDTSSLIYSYLHTHCYSANRLAVNLLLNRTEAGRNFLLDVLTSQFLSDAQYGSNDIVRRPTLNSQSNTILNRDEVRVNTISIETEMLIEDSISYFGINLTYMGMFPPALLNLARNYGD